MALRWRRTATVLRSRATAAGRRDGSRTAVGPTRCEIACGLVINVEPEAPRLTRGLRPHPRAAIEEVIRGALAHPPCVVSFSGGRDSSAVLAVAAAIARREGLPLPVPATHRFPGAPATREDGWQETVVRHLDLPDWERLTATDALDSVGPVARAVLRRHGVLWPFNAHFHVPLLDLAAGGSLLTGIGGDELFGSQRWAIALSVLTGRRRPAPRHLRALALALAPRPARRRVLNRRHQIRWPWLHQHVESSINRQRVAWQVRTPLRWPAALDWWWRSRHRVVLSETCELLANDAGTRLAQPFLERSVLEAAAAHYGARGPVNRTEAMRELFADVLPASVVARRTKATFDEAFFSDHSRAFAAAWTGGGIDDALINADRLAAVWHSCHPDPRSFSLLQSAWLAAEGTVADHRSAHGRADAATIAGPQRGRSC